MAEKKSHEVDPWLARKDRSAPIVLVFGPDRGLVVERGRRIASDSGLSLDDPFSVVRLDAAQVESQPGLLDEEASALSMFATRRLIWVRGAANGKALVDAVKRLSASPPRDTTILIEAGDLKKGVGLRAVAAGSASVVALPCYADDSRAISALIDQELAAAGKSISAPARESLMEALGGDRLASRSELGKLLLYCDSRDRIELDDVLASVSDVSGPTTDALVDAALSGKIADVEQEFSRSAASGTNPFQLLSATARQLQSLRMIRLAMDRDGKSAASAVAGARPPIFFSRQKQTEQALSLWREPEISTVLRAVQTAVLRTRQLPDLAESTARNTLFGIARRAGLQRKPS
jgi:DNA polymerase III subunit delta